MLHNNNNIIIMLLRRTKANTVLVSLMAMAIFQGSYHHLQSHAAEALSIRIIARPASPTRIARNVIDGLTRPFRTTSVKDVMLDQSPQLYNLGLQPTVHTTTQSSHQNSRQTNQLGATTSTAQALSIPEMEVYAIPSATFGRINVRTKVVDEWNLQKVVPPPPRQTVVVSIIFAESVAEPQIDDSVIATRTSLVGNLIQPFEACMDKENDEIRLDYLLDACKKFKHAMVAFGQKAMSENMAQNIEKVERARAMAPPEHQKTLRSLLQYEKACGVRSPSDGKLRKESAAMSLLWIRRSVAFQHQFNINLVEQPELPSLAAATRAYEKEVEPYHSWGLKKVFKVALRTTTPPRSKTLAQLHGSADDDLNETELVRTIEEIKALRDTWQPLLNQWKSTFESLQLEDDSKA